MWFFDWLFKKDAQATEIEVKPTEDFSSFGLVTDFIYHESGITELEQRALTASKLKQFALSHDIFTTEEFLSQIKKSQELYQEVMNIVTVNETYFFRELEALKWLVEYIVRKNRELKILSIPCSSGEEVYSLLILLQEQSFDINKIKIDAYDINSNAIKKAKKGIYNKHSLHKLESKIKENYFQKEGDFYSVDSSLKKQVNFSQQNIFHLEGKKDLYDVVLSRNMFIYFDKKHREKATKIIVNLLHKDSIYIKGHADQISAHPKLENIAFGVYQKV